MRRWIGAVVFVVGLGIVALVIPRLAPRSPVAIILVCVLGVLTMKLVERRVRRWFDHRAARQRAGPTLPPGRH